MYDSHDSPQVRAAKASGEARRLRATERRAREARHRHYAKGHAEGHPFICVCDDCEAVREGKPEADCHCNQCNPHPPVPSHFDGSHRHPSEALRDADPRIRAAARRARA
jgi:hypothetical protein